MHPDGKILFATDLSDCAARAYSYAVEMAARLRGELHVAHVHDSPGSGVMDTVDLRPPPEQERHTAFERQPLPEIERLIEVEVAAETAPLGIIRYARQHEIDLIVIGARGLGGARKPAIGTVARDVVRHAPCPVLMVRDRLPYAGIRRIMVPVDFSAASRETLRQALHLADLWDANLELLHVVAPRRGEAAFAIYPSTRPILTVADEWEARLAAFAAEVGADAYEPVIHVRVGPPAPTIINFALERGPDLIVIGSHGQTASPEAPMGSVAGSISRSALCPVLTLRSLPAVEPRDVKPQSSRRSRNPRPTSARERAGAPAR